jgi:hypothetical protein
MAGISTSGGRPASSTLLSGGQPGGSTFLSGGRPASYALGGGNVLTISGYGGRTHFVDEDEQPLPGALTDSAAS